MSTPLPENARCLQCDYQLRGLTKSRCPECGRDFDPADLLSYRLPEVSDRTYRWAGSPNRALLPIVIVLLLFYVFFMPPDIFSETILLAFSIALMLGLALDAIGRREARKELADAAPELADPSRFQKSDRAARLSIVWLLCGTIAAGLLLDINIPLLVSFQFSRPALEREVAAIRSQLPRGTPGFFPLNRRVGSFKIRSIRVDPGNNFNFWTDGNPIIYSEATPIPDSYWLSPHWRMKRPHW